MLLRHTGRKKQRGARRAEARFSRGGEGCMSIDASRGHPKCKRMAAPAACQSPAPRSSGRQSSRCGAVPGPGEGL